MQYTLRIITSKVYSLVISGYSVTASWFLNIRQRMRMSIPYMSLIYNIIMTLRIRSRMTINNTLVKLVIRLTQTILMGRQRLVATMRQRMSALANIAFRNVMIGIYNLRIRFLNLTVRVPKISILAVPIYARFNPLYTFDGMTLDSLSGSTISQMDYMIT